jgi:hypothetical protein
MLLEKPEFDQQVVIPAEEPGAPATTIDLHVIPAEGSLICQVIPKPEIADGSLLLLDSAIMRLERSKDWEHFTPDQAREFVYEMMRQLFRPGVTYAQYQAYLLGRIDFVNEYLGAELWIASRYLKLPGFQLTMPIKSYDKYLMWVHFQNHLSVISFYG